MKEYALAAVLILGVPLATPAESPLEECRRLLFERADVNRDGVLSRGEASAEPLGMDSSVFNMADGNQDGVLDHHEYEKLGIFISCEMCPAGPGCDTP